MEGQPQQPAADLLPTGMGDMEVEEVGLSTDTPVVAPTPFSCATPAPAPEVGLSTGISVFAPAPFSTSSTTTTTTPTFEQAFPLPVAMDQEDPDATAHLQVPPVTCTSPTEAAPHLQQLDHYMAAPPLPTVVPPSAAAPLPPQLLPMQQLHQQSPQQQTTAEEEMEEGGEGEEAVVEDDLQAAAMAAEVPAWALAVEARPETRHRHPDALIAHEEVDNDEEDDSDEDDEEAAIVGYNAAVDDGDDDEGGTRKGGKAGRLGFDASEIPRTKHELTVAEEVVIPAEGTLEPAGAVEGMVEGFLVVAADPHRQTLDIDNVLCFQDRTPLGKVYEVFGPVKKPYYSVVQANVERLKAQGKDALLAPGTPVYFVPQASSYVQPAQLYSKGSDASGEHDEEPPDDELEFSDDEQEAMHRRQRKKKLQDKRRQAQEWEGNAEMALRAGPASSHPPSSSGAPHHPSAPGRGRGSERGRRRATNRGGFAGGGWARPQTHVPGPYHGASDYTPLQRPSHLVDHVMSNPSYGAPPSGPAYPPPPYGAPYGMPHYGAQAPPPMGGMPVPLGASGQPQPMPLPMPLPMPQQPYMGGGAPLAYPPGVQAQASWQNQFYSSPHHHNPSS